MTLLCAAILLEGGEGCVDRALASARASRTAGADLVEFRADDWIDADSSEADARAAADRLSDLIARAPLPVIATCRPEWEGGACAAAEPVRFALLSRVARARKPPAHIDVELAALDRYPPWRSLVESLSRAASDAGDGAPAARVILSLHDFAGRPADLLRRVRVMRESPAAALKIVHRARSVRDNLELFDLLRERDRPTIALAMGEAGALSRILAPKFSGFAVYAPAPSGCATAPGQIGLAELLDVYRVRSVSGSTRVFGVIGEPVSHSLSPVVHNAGFATVGFDGVYAPLPVADSWESFKATLAALLAQAGLDFAGASVTIPHKEHALRFAIEARKGGGNWEIDQWALRAGAVNTLAQREDGSWLASNTDAPAIAACLRDAAIAADLAGARAVVLGAGGVARAAAVALLDLRAKVRVCARRREQAEALVKEIRNAGGAARGIETAAWGATVEDARVVINCTPVGMASGGGGGESPIGAAALDSLRAGAVVFDTVYNPLRTPLLTMAGTRGLATVDGLQLFVRQAAGQFELWTGAAAPTALFERVSRERLASG